MQNDLSHCNVSLVSGIGSSNTSKLNAFDRALSDAGILNCNLVKISSVVPKSAIYVNFDKEKYKFKKGILLPIAYTYNYIEEQFNTAQFTYCQVAVAPTTNFRNGGIIVEYSGASSENEQDFFKNNLQKIILEALQDRNISVDVDKDIKYITSYINCNNYFDYKYTCLFAGCILWRTGWLDDAYHKNNYLFQDR